MTKFQLFYSDINPDTGVVTKIKEICLIECSENSIEWIKFSLSLDSEDPNRDFFYFECKPHKISMKNESIELLNSEGPILVAKKVDGDFHIVNQEGRTFCVLSVDEIVSFINGDMVICDYQEKCWKYTEFSKHMKPENNKLLEFIGRPSFSNN